MLIMGFFGCQSGVNVSLIGLDEARVREIGAEVRFLNINQISLVTNTR